MKKAIQFLALAILMAGCSGDGIFYNLEKEEKIKDANNLSDSISLDQMIEYGDQYVLNGKRVWHSTNGTDTNKWHSYPVPSGYDKDASFPSIGVLNSNLYATIISHDAKTRSGLLKYNAGSEEWEELFHYNQDSSGSSKYTYYNMYLFQVSNGLYVNLVEYYKNADYEVSIQDSHLYFYSSDAAGESNLANDGLTSSYEVTLDGGDFVNMPIVAITSDTVASEHYLVYNTSDSSFKSGVVASASSATATSSRSFTTVSDSVFSGYNYTTIYYSPQQDMLFIGTKADDNKHPILYYDGSNWHSKTWKSDEQFSTFCDIHDSTGAIQSNTILAGTQAFTDPTSNNASIKGNGYIEIVVNDKTDPTLQSNNFSDDNNYNSSDLEDATIKQFLYDSSHDRLYAATTNYGLWLNTPSGSGRKWAQE